ncbi:MAG: thrombospondin type 3 repeat-containing protein [Polyangiaceae bacterium]
MTTMTASLDGLDAAPENPAICRDVDADGCSDCALTLANGSGGNPLGDGSDVDADGLCDVGDSDDDNDGVLDANDVAPSDPMRCRDVDADSCDDCAISGANQSGGSPSNDGLDTDADGSCDTTDTDDDNDGVADGIDVASRDAHACRDVDLDGCDDCTATGANASGGSTLNDGIDTDNDGSCDVGDGDDDNDGVADGTDAAAQNAFICRDVDADGCDDCSVTGPNGSGGSTTNDGLDRDGDGRCDATDPDVDNDGVPDVDDSAPFDASRCRDVDRDSCDDCAVTGANGSGGNVSNDGPDFDHDGSCNEADSDDDDDGVNDVADVAPLDPRSCRDVDDDTCDDCSNTGANLSGGNVASDGTDSDADGRCDDGDDDDDNDGVLDVNDSAHANPNACRDLDSDGCDDCTNTGANRSGGDPSRDGADLDGDGQCDLADPDIDNDGVPDVNDGAPSDARACRDLDKDGCDDCALTGANGSGGNVNGDGADLDADGACDVGDPDDDNDGVIDIEDRDRTEPRACRDSDGDGCDDCSLSGANGSGGNESNDGLDTDADGICDLGDDDDDDDGVLDSSDATPTNPNVCRDLDVDGCDDCSATGANRSGGNPANDGLDLDGDGQCDVADPDVDNDGVPDLSDIEPQNPRRCRDADGDSCDDCSSTGANGTGGNISADGPDFDNDGACDDGDLDDDGDGVPDSADQSPYDALRCKDDDADTCDDCAISGNDGSGGSVISDGVDTDLDGRCDSGDLDDDHDGVPDVNDREPLQPNICRDTDEDTCDDCSLSGANGSGGNPLLDGLDADGDGRCDAGELDDDNDGVVDTSDVAPLDATRCRDVDSDGCDDCSVTHGDGSGGSVANDGIDTDSDGKCDLGDTDDDNDGVLDGVDLATRDPLVCRDVDEDGCDDCALTGANGSGGNPLADGADLDGDGRCDVLDLDLDNDGVPNTLDTAPSRATACRDVDEDGCDDCALTGANGSGGSISADGLDSDGDGFCDVGDADDDNDGVCDGALAHSGTCVAGPDTDSTRAASCRDVDHDGCDDCSASTAPGGNTATDGPDLDADGLCDTGDLDDDGDGVLDASDEFPRDPARCRDVDRDTCDDCSLTRADGSGGDPLDDGVDRNADGICDQVQDVDGDGVSLETDLDADNDGIPNVDESELHLDPLGDKDGDGISNYLDSSDRGDGQKNDCPDGDGSHAGDGRCDRLPRAFDVDQDGTPNFLDLDSDEDHIYDIAEAGHVARDDDNDGRVDDACGSNGFVDLLETSPGSGVRRYELSNVDSDSLPDFLDVDADDDSLLDTVEARDTDLRTRAPDSDGDGVADYRDRDSDGDLIYDDDEAAEDSRIVLDTDADGTPDYLDVDSDGDELDDVDEAGDERLDTPPIDTDGDGKPDFQDVDSDGDGVVDGVDTCRFVEDSSNRDSDGDGIGDVCETDLDGDSVPDESDNCPRVANEGQEDDDDDGIGDACDTDASDRDGDGIEDSVDNCPKNSNRRQTDSDGDGKGNACDSNDDMTLEGGGCAMGTRGTPRDSVLLSLGLLAVAWIKSVRRKRQRAAVHGQRCASVADPDSVALARHAVDSDASPDASRRSG